MKILYPNPRIFWSGDVSIRGYPLFLSSNDLQIGRGEPTIDTARVLSRYCDGIMIRTFGQEEVEELAKYSQIPVINGLTDFAHPCQILADLLTIREYKGSFEGLKVCFIGDTNNMANSLIVGSLKLGMQFSLATPDKYQLHPEIAAFVADNPLFEQTSDVLAAASQARRSDYRRLGVNGRWRRSRAKKQDFAGFQINQSVMDVAKEDAIALHCLPAHREEEITTEVLKNMPM